MSETVIDLFAGPGGWDVAAGDLGLDPLGVELDAAACATRRAAGLRTSQADVAVVNPQAYAGLRYAGHRIDGLIASPPCQAWSMAGKRGGERDEALVYETARSLLDGDDVRGQLGPRCGDPRSLLVVEPLRWLLALQPTWLAFEQVPPVLEFWQWLREPLWLRGYNVWTGILSAERYGVPQTRKRAILMAHRERPVAPPTPTHQAYVPGEPARHEYTLEGELLPWVSMAGALGWREGEAPAPAPTVSGGGTESGGGVEVFASADSRRRVARAVSYDRRQTGGDGTPVGSRPVDEPAPTLQAQGLAKGRDVWVYGRPATTVNGDPRISKPGHHDEDESGSQQKGAVRVTEQEAAILQGFPPDYPFQGSRTKRFEQIGNAVPPPLARAILSELERVEPLERAEAEGRPIQIGICEGTDVPFGRVA